VNLELFRRILNRDEFFGHAPPPDRRNADYFIIDEKLLSRKKLVHPTSRTAIMFYEKLLVVWSGLTVRHHTKDKGDEGLGQVIADLMTNGVQVAVPLSEHLPFDLIAIGEHGIMRRVQVRYRASADAAQLRCGLGGSWADRRGSHHRAFDASAIDVLAIYCPSPKTFVYLRADELPPNYVSVRLAKAKNGQVKRTRDASEYRDPWRMFGPAVHHGEHVLWDC